MLKKLFLIPWFGPFPEWMERYQENAISLEKYGYEFHITTDENDFSTRVEKALGFTPAIQPGTSLSHNYRSAFGLIYADILKGYDFWGITDLDCVYGNPTHFVSDQKLENLDIWSNHHNYICGPWTLFRNTEAVNNLFKEVPEWETLMRSTQNQPGRWTEVEYTQAVDKSVQEAKMRRLYTHFQGKDPNVTFNLRYKNGELFDGEDEIFMFHFNRTKKYPVL